MDNSNREKHAARGSANQAKPLEASAFNAREVHQTVPWREPVNDLIQNFAEPGSALKGARIKENLSQSELAEKLSIPQSHISDMEHGRRPIGKKMAKRLAAVLKVGYKIFL